MIPSFASSRPIAALLLLAIPALASASANPWHDNYAALEKSIGNRYSDTLSASALWRDRDSSELGWGESYVLRSYRALYLHTGNRAWLIRMKEHISALVQAADDTDGDGYLGWSSMQYSPVRITNTGFETGDTGDRTQPAGWTRIGPAEATTRVSTDRVSGSWSLEIRSDEGHRSGIYQDLKSYDRHIPHVLRFQAKGNGRSGRASIRDVTSGNVLRGVPFNSTTWQYVELPFTTPDSGHKLRVSFELEPPAGPLLSNGKIWLDDVVVSSRVPYLVHHGLIGVGIAEYIRLVEELATDGVLTASDPLVAAKDDFKTFLTTQIIPQWDSPSSVTGNTWVDITPVSGSYQQPLAFQFVDTDVRFTYLPYNQANVFYEMLAVLSRTTGNAACLDRAERGARYFKDALVARGPGYTWNYGYYSQNVEDTSHANLDVALALVLFQLHRVFTGDDMDRLTSTLTKTMWNGSVTAPTVSAAVDGSGDGHLSKYLFMWTDLSQFDPAVWPIAAAQFRHGTQKTMSELLTLSSLLRWDPSRIVNRGFELASGTDPADPARWERRGSQTTRGNAFLDRDNARRGAFGLTLKARDGKAGPQVSQTWTDWTVPGAYILEVFARSDGPAVGGRACIRDDSDGSVYALIVVDSPAWRKYTASFTLPREAAGHSLRICLETGDAAGNGQVHFDGIRIRWNGDPTGPEDNWDEVAGY